MLSKLLDRSDPFPNKFTRFMGERIREAREQQGMSQKDLADRIFSRQAAVSDIERGKMEVGVLRLARIAAHLQKPLTYFFHPDTVLKIRPEDLDPEEQELLIQFRRLSSTDTRRIITQMRALAELAEKDDLARIEQSAQRSIRAMRSKSTQKKSK